MNEHIRLHRTSQRLPQAPLEMHSVFLQEEREFQEHMEARESEEYRAMMVELEKGMVEASGEAEQENTVEEGAGMDQG